MKWIIYWAIYTSSLHGPSETSGVMQITKDSITTYLGPYQYATFKIDYLEGNKECFTLIGSRPHCMLFIYKSDKHIYQNLVINELHYRDSATMKVRHPKPRKRKKTWIQ